MADQRSGGIAWCDTTWNPVRGCSRVSRGCDHCYAERRAARFCGPGQPYEGLIHDGRWTRSVRLVPERLADPLRWTKPRRVFVNSMSDLFHERLPSDDLWSMIAVMAAARTHTFQVLTKRPERMRGELNCSIKHAAGCCEAALLEMGLAGAWNLVPFAWPLRNVWWGVSCEDQTTADKRIPLLLETPAAVRWLSVEPMLGPVTLAQSYPVGWLVVGGESGPGHRVFNLDWLAALVGECRDAGIPVWVKQDSGPRPGRQGRIPADLWVHEWPAQCAFEAAP